MRMRHTIIGMLAYPRSMARSSIGLEDCSHDGSYATDDQECLDCEFRHECRWLYRADEFADLEHRPLAALVEALDFAVEYVRARMTRAEHDFERCRCESCLWLRDSERLLEQTGED